MFPEDLDSSSQTAELGRLLSLESPPLALPTADLGVL